METEKGRRRRSSGLKRGPLSQEERSYIERYKDRQTPEYMATRLRRSTDTVRKYLDDADPTKPRTRREMQLADELELRPEWGNFKQQFTEDELVHFKYRYVQIMDQFHDQGIMATEEMQIFQVISLDILVQRTLKEQRQVTESMERIHREIESLAEQAGDADKGKIKSLEAAYCKHADSIKNLSQRYESYTMRQSAMLKELKATRDQRVKLFQDVDKSFLGFLRLLNEEDQRLAIGREAELMRIAAEKERERLSKPHQFADGMIDQPILVPEDVREY